MTHEVVPRPDGGTYRARKTPRAEILSEWDEDLEVIVWRTHDVDVATALAGAMWRCYTDGPLPGSGEVGWWKSVPWDASGGGYDWTVVSCSPAERGAVPAVMFR